MTPDRRDFLKTLAGGILAGTLPASALVVSEDPWGTGSPIEDIRAMKARIEADTGLRPARYYLTPQQYKAVMVEVERMRYEMVVYGWAVLQAPVV